jgi:hypothetical protein
MNDPGGVFNGDGLHVDRSAIIPGHPAALLRSPMSTWEAARGALAELERLRGGAANEGGYSAECHQAVWQAAISAAYDTASQLVRDTHPSGSWPTTNPAPKVPTLHVVHSGPGSGKSTAAKVFIAGVTRVTEDHRYPTGCALLVHHVETAAKAFAELSTLLPGKVAVWSSEHDANSPIVIRQPRFTVDELEEYPVVVVTHEFYRGVRGERARSFCRNGLTLPRFVTFVDEKVNEVETYTLVLSQVQRVIEHVERDEQAAAELRSGLDTLETEHEARSTEPPSLTESEGRGVCR